MLTEQCSPTNSLCRLAAGNELLGKFCTDLEQSIVESIEAGFYTKVRRLMISAMYHHL